MKRITISLVIALTAVMSLNSQTILTPVADTYVSKIGVNGTELSGDETRGNEKKIASYRNPSTKPVWWSIIYMKFDLRGIKSVSNVKLRLYGKITEAHGLDVYKTSLTTWSEETLSFNNAENEVGMISEAPVATLDIAINPNGQYYEWDVSEAVLNAIQKGETEISFRIQDRYMVKNEKGIAIQAQFQSKESPYGKKPQLLIQSN